MSIISKTKAEAKSATVSAREFNLYDANRYKLIPLRLYTDSYTKRNKRTGKTRVMKTGKAPRDKNWPTRDYSSYKVRRECATNNRNMGVRLTPDLVIIDVDPRNGGTKGFAKLCDDLFLDPKSWPHVITGSGGSHYYLTKPADIAVRDTLDEYPGVEFKSKGRQVVAAGSIHPDTLKLYRWDIKSPSLNEPAMCPDQLLAIIKRPQVSGLITGGGQLTQEELADMLAKIPVEDFDTNEKWFRIMAAAHHATNGDGRHEFIEWSIQDERYADDAEIIGRRWDSLHKNKPAGITYKTLNSILREYGANDAQHRDKDEAQDDFADADDFDAPLSEEDVPDDWLDLGDKSVSLVTLAGRGLRLNSQQRALDTYENALIACARANLSPALNELQQTIVLRADPLPWSDDYGRVVDDNVARNVRTFLMRENQGVGYEPSKENVNEALAFIAFQAKFNPILEYVDSLKWDGVQRVKNLFGAYFKCGDTAYTRSVSRCVMTAAIRRNREPGCKFDTMPVLRGKQGVGKSTGIKALFGAEYFSDADLGSLRNKDAAMNLNGVWVQEFAEIDSLTRHEAGELKGFLSRAVDRYRAPFGKFATNAARRCVFIGTVNEGGYLKDATGGRRFWPLEVQGPIDVEAIKRDRDQLWAEAAHLEASGASVVLPPELWTVAAKRQAEQTTNDPWADTINAHLDSRIFEDDTARDRIHSSELFTVLDIPAKDQTRDKGQRLRVVMENVIGWRHKTSLRIGDEIRAGYERA